MNEALLDEIASELTPHPHQVATARSRAETLIHELHAKQDAWMFSVVRHVSHGSHSRGTALAGFKDIDYLVVLDPAFLVTQAGKPRSARDTVAKMRDAIEHRRAGLVSQGYLEVRAQDHSVGVKYLQSNFRVDLVPAQETGQRGVYRVPDRRAGAWIETHPERLRQRQHRALGYNPALAEGIRLLKGWRRARGKPMYLPSYAIELLATEIALETGSLTELVEEFFRRFAGAHKGHRLVLGGGAPAGPVSLVDPASGADVCAELTREHRTRLVEKARLALDELTYAARLVENGHDGPARTRLRKLFVGSAWMD